MASAAVVPRKGAYRRRFLERDKNLLTPREEQIARLIVQGYSTKDLSLEFNCAIQTVQCHRYNMATKLGAHSALQLGLRITDYFRGKGVPLDGEMLRAGID